MVTRYLTEGGRVIEESFPVEIIEVPIYIFNQFWVKSRSGAAYVANFVIKKKFGKAYIDNTVLFVYLNLRLSRIDMNELMRLLRATAPEVTDIDRYGGSGVRALPDSVRDKVSFS